MDLNSENFAFEEDDEDGLSLEQVIQLTEEAWLNEKFAPEILPHKSEIVDLLLGQISYMEERLQQLQSTDFKKAIHQMEVDRLRFLVTSYLRLRLEKIETFCTHTLQQERHRADKGEDMYLSQNELEFAQEHEQNMKDHLESVMSFCPNVMDTETPEVCPNVHSMVFLKSKRDIEGVAIDDGDGDNNDLIDLTSGSQILISYNSVARLVKDGDVHLI
ncbi:DNA replication complex GINS protein SLD5 [Euwallacea fornicatus]|uniref:DNA replication complex GINS protein SLD5 n=1 Tax=Euwallacea fornicatus TaxID=995702 RepID=UPI00338EF4A3